MSFAHGVLPKSQLRRMAHTQHPVLKNVVVFEIANDDPLVARVITCDVAPVGLEELVVGKPVSGVSSSLGLPDEHLLLQHRGQRDDRTDVIEPLPEIADDRLRGVRVAARAVKDEVELALLDVRARLHEPSDITKVYGERLWVDRARLVPARAVVDDGATSVLVKQLQVATPQEIGRSRDRRGATGLLSRGLGLRELPQFLEQVGMADGYPGLVVAA